MLSDRFPRLVICAAPRCGTTSLYTYLGEHPQICISKIKETHFFLGGNHPLRRDVHCDNADPEAYAEYFSHCLSSLLRVGDDPYYLYSQSAMERLLSLPSDPAALFIFRNPTERLRSFFSYSQSNRLALPKHYDFDRYVAELFDGSFLTERGDRYPLEAAALDQGEYINYLEPIWQQVKDRAIVLFSEELWRNPCGTMQTVVQRMGLDSSFYTEHRFRVKNESIGVRNRRLHALARGLQRLTARETDSFATRWPGRAPLVKLYKTINYRRDRIPTMSIETRQRLDAYYALSNERLFDLLNRAPVPEWEA